MSNGDLYVVLGCFGYRDDDFINCNGIENRILNINDNLMHYNKLMDYLDNCRLFDKATFDYNAIRHFIFHIRDKFEQPNKLIWSEKRFTTMERFTIDHRKCGLYLKLILINQEFKQEEEKKEEVKVFIPGSDNKINKMREILKRANNDKR